ncbi:hypothetical protein V6N13_124866 [Hibiscus sabdariffa]
MQELSTARSSSVLRMGPIVTTQSAATGWKLLRLGWVCLNVDGAVSLDIGLIMRLIREMFGRGWDIELSYVPHEFNTMADKITSIMCGKPIGEVSFEVVPSLVSVIVATKALLGRHMHEDPGG